MCPANLKYFDTEYGEPQEIAGKNAAEIEERCQQVETYMKEKVNKLSMYLSVRETCMNRDKLCTKWSVEGECEKNPAWMMINCAVSGKLRTVFFLFYYIRDGFLPIFILPVACMLFLRKD